MSVAFMFNSLWEVMKWLQAQRMQRSHEDCACEQTRATTFLAQETFERFRLLAFFTVALKFSRGQGIGGHLPQIAPLAFPRHSREGGDP